MEDDKRLCIFTQKLADAKLTITKDKHNWAKKVPCSKEFLEQKKDSTLTDDEFQLVELFFAKEILLSKIENIERLMNEKRAGRDIGLIIHEPPPAYGYFAKLNVTENLTEEEEDDKVEKDKPDLWD